MVKSESVPRLSTRTPFFLPPINRSWSTRGQIYSFYFFYFFHSSLRHSFDANKGIHEMRYSFGNEARNTHEPPVVRGLRSIAVVYRVGVSYSGLYDERFYSFPGVKANLNEIQGHLSRVTTIKQPPWVNGAYFDRSIYLFIFNLVCADLAIVVQHEALRLLWGALFYVRRGKLRRCLPRMRYLCKFIFDVIFIIGVCYIIAALLWGFRTAIYKSRRSS